MTQQRPLPRRDGGRTCGCDPKADHSCAEHRAQVDVSQTVITDEIAVSGPVNDMIALYVEDDALVYLSRFEAEDMANEILRRLSERAEL